MKMSNVRELLTKEMFVEMLSRSCCDVCPFQQACHESAVENTEETCEEFLNRYIEDEG